MLLNDGVSPSGTHSLKPETIEKMFKNQIPHLPNFGCNKLPSVKPEYVNDIPELYPQPREQVQGWGPIFFLTPPPGSTGCGPTTAHCAGLPNLFRRCDRAKGVTRFLWAQTMPSRDLKTTMATVGFEGMVYPGLRMKGEKGTDVESNL